ncbi:E3 ubiquitin-protein ligase sina-like [Centruroides sculpturatus]|uniref:E3 ubiquitin-protein ligase sina-like n=1 Tax=Centruroides sculpturatus TaxID=218467 RepID=UPI000C6E4BC7|nr:E3 ubiquitin-protein ligase sina-like [Centruroides sculpturatus]
MPRVRKPRWKYRQTSIFLHLFLVRGTMAQRRKQERNGPEAATRQVDLGEMAIALAGLLDCPVCWERATPPISLCVNGHIVCPRCSGRVERCPTCRGPLNGGRCLALEQMVGVLAHPCRYHHQGCREFLSPGDTRAHEKHCAFRSCPCPVLDPACWWQGPRAAIPGHLAGMHPEIGEGVFSFLKMFLLGWQRPRRSSWVACLASGHCQFLAQVVKEERKEGQTHTMVYFLLRSLGKKEDVKRFRYEIRLGEGCQRIVYEDEPRWVVGSLPSTFKHGDCLALPYTMVAGLMQDQALPVTMAVHPVGGRRRPGEAAPPEVRNEDERDTRSERADEASPAPVKDGEEDPWAWEESPLPGPQVEAQSSPQARAGNSGETSQTDSQPSDLLKALRRAQACREWGHPAKVLLPVGEPLPAELQSIPEQQVLEDGDAEPGPADLGRGQVSGESRLGAALRGLRSRQNPNSTRVEYYPG